MANVNGDLRKALLLLSTRRRLHLSSLLCSSLASRARTDGRPTPLCARVTACDHYHWTCDCDSCWLIISRAMLVRAPFAVLNDRMQCNHCYHGRSLLLQLANIISRAMLRRPSECSKPQSSVAIAVEVQWSARLTLSMQVIVIGCHSICHLSSQRAPPTARAPPPCSRIEQR